MSENYKRLKEMLNQRGGKAISKQDEEAAMAKIPMPSKAISREDEDDAIEYYKNKSRKNTLKD